MTSRNVVPDTNGKSKHIKGQVTDLLDRVGFDMKDITKIKLSSGIIGKIAPMTNYLSLSLVAFGMVCVWKDLPWYIGGGSVGCAVLVYLVGTSQILRVAKEQPDMALLEGAELLAYRQQAYQYLAKNLPMPTTIEIPQSDPTVPAIEPPKDLIDQPETNEGELEANN